MRREKTPHNSGLFSFLNHGNLAQPNPFHPFVLQLGYDYQGHKRQEGTHVKVL